MLENKNERYWVQLTKDPLDPNVFSFLTAPDAGGISVFVGTTRAITGPRETDRLEYEAYEPMALSVMSDLVEETYRRWPVVHVVLLHRLGEVPAEGASVVVGVSAAHRDVSFEACRFLIDSLKKEVPIWKKERYIDGTSEWVQGA